MSEREFWRSTPRKVDSLYKIHKQFNGWEVETKHENKQSKALYIDQVSFL